MYPTKQTSRQAGVPIVPSTPQTVPLSSTTMHAPGDYSPAARGALCVSQALRLDSNVRHPHFPGRPPGTPLRQSII